MYELLKNRQRSKQTTTAANPNNCEVPVYAIADFMLKDLESGLILENLL